MKESNFELIRQHVLNAYIETGKHVFVSDLMQHFQTSAKGIHNALGYDDFVFDHDSKWTGTNYAGKYVNAPCVEPSKTFLVNLIKTLRG